ncbi:unnamed protein product [Gemmata massiliana]|uniref:Uncharacterized protein n=1 Tax=Gemmata massiliana TaxID=1210884 RepID=A0A6P2D132_9BACT|nr:hypothetical protein [Gemmata massiliana]VTR93160.1 unnamed protein product [Gemmata massiliana]
MRFLVALGCALVVGGEVTAVDYDKVERRLTKEPVYQTKKPRYALLLFGKDAKLPVWVVLDGETVFVDRNGDGDLTGEGEKFAKEAECKAIEIKDPDGKTRYTIDRIQTDHSFYTAKVRQEREGKGVPPGLMAYVSIKGAAEYQQYCDIVEMRDSPKEAMLAHFHGPLTIAPMTINWKLPASTALRKGKNPPEFIANIGTMSEKHGCWVVVRTCDEKECAFPAGVRPMAEVEFPAATPEGAPIKKTYTLSGYRCGAAFRENLQVPDGVGAGKAKVRLSFDAWKDGRVAPSTFEIPVREPEVDTKDK